MSGNAQANLVAFGRSVEGNTMVSQLASKQPEESWPAASCNSASHSEKSKEADTSVEQKPIIAMQKIDPADLQLSDGSQAGPNIESIFCKYCKNCRDI